MEGRSCMWQRVRSKMELSSRGGAFVYMVELSKDGWSCQVEFSCVGGALARQDGVLQWTNVDALC